MRMNLSKNVSFEWLEGRELFSSYFVSTSGSDSGAGTAAAPWKSLQHAADTVKAGDTVNVAAGNYAGFSAFTLRGTSAAHIVFKADAGVNITSKAANQSAVDCGIELSGYDSSSGSAYVDLYGFNVNNSSGTIKGAISSGIRIRYSNNIGIYNCTTTNNGWVGIYCAYVSNITIDGCSSFNNNLFVDSSTQRNHGIYVANSSTSVTIRNTTVHDQNGNGIHMNGDGGVNKSFLLEGNVVYNNGTLGGSAINCDGLQSSTLRNNLLYNNKNKGIALYNSDASGGSLNNTIVNNTVVMGTASGNAALQLKGSATGNKVFNNIFINLGTGTAIDMYSTADAGSQIDYNIYGGPAKMMSGDGSLESFSTWRSNNPTYDVHSTTSAAAALFVNYTSANYHLLSTAPAVDKGTSTSAPASDQDKVARPQGAAIDIGAYEYSTGSGGTVTIPADPTALSAAATAWNQIHLAWTDNSSNETGFIIYRKVGSAGTFAPIATTAAGVTTYDDTGLSGNTSYYYKVVATNSAGTSTNATNTDSALTPAQPTAPTAPSGLIASATSASAVSLTWTDNSTDESGFKVERQSGTGTWTQIGTTSAGVATYTDSNLTASTQYNYRVRATNAVGDSTYSATATVTTDASATVPAAPSGLVASATSASAVALTWTDNSTNETGFRIERSLDGATNWIQAGTVANNITTFSASGLEAQTKYYFRVIATNAVGDSNPTAPASATTQALPTIPSAPTGLVASVTSSSAISLTWIDTSTDETNFKIERSLNGSTWTQIATTSAGVTTYSATGLSAGTTYYFRVRATNVAGDSDYSNTDVAATESVAVDTTAPTASATLGNITAAGDGSYTFTVTYNDDAGIDDTLLDNDDILVTGPNGYSQRATFISATSANSGKTAIATYKITSPASSWSWQDDGAYTVSLRDQEVADDIGNFAAPATLGTFTVAVPSVDYAGDSRATARYLGVITSAKSVTPSDTVETLDIQDYYRVRISSTSTLTAKMYNLTDDANLQLRAEDGTLISTSGRAGTSYEYISRTLKPGTYYYRVINNGNPGTNYALRVAIAAPAVGGAPGGLTGPDYAGNSRALARKGGSFTPGRVSVYTDLVAPSDTQDYYRFDMSAAGSFTAKLTNLTGDVNMQLLDSAGKLIQISGNTGTIDESITRTLSAGTYYLRLYTLGGAGTNYRLRMSA